MPNFLGFLLGEMMGFIVWGGGGWDLLSGEGGDGGKDLGEMMGFIVWGGGGWGARILLRGCF